MKVKIKKKEKVKEYKVIESWDDVTLEKWIKLVNLKKGSRSKEALETISELSNISKKLIKQLGIQDVAAIMKYVTNLQNKKDSSFKRIIKVENVEYGFHPDFEKLTLGEYADLETFIKNGVENNLPEIMAILYRPVVEKKNNVYTIKAYDGDIAIRTEIMKKMSASQVQKSLVFFWNFVNELLKILPLYLMEQMPKKQKQQLMEILQKSGVGLV